MKPLFTQTLLLFLIFLSSCNSEKLDKNFNNEAVIYITKTDMGFNIYSNKKELILEYTKQNCDSLSLVTLEEIYYTAKEFYNKDIPKEKREFQQTTFIGVLYE